MSVLSPSHDVLYFCLLQIHIIRELKAIYQKYYRNENKVAIREITKSIASWISQSNNNCGMVNYDYYENGMR